MRDVPLPVAVVLAFYRADATFPAALASVLAQSVPAAEIMVVDDGSPYGTARTLEQLPSGVGIVRLQSNIGVNGARRAGTAATTAPLVAYLDADDRWPVNYLATMVAALETAATAPAAFAAAARVWPDGRREVFAHKPAQLTIREAIVRSHAIPSAMVMRRSAVEAVGGWHDDRWVIDDWHMIVRLIDAFGPMHCVPEVVIEYAVGNTGSLNSLNLRVLRQWWHTLDQLGPLVERHYGRGAARRRFAQAMIDRSHRVGGVTGGLLRLGGRLIGPPLDRDQRRAS
jgi:glycosyltransferase involved in cell wall biosynthesis